jgi:hypothetical protein
MKTLHSLEQKHFIRISEDADINSPSLPGSPLSLKVFKSWIADAAQTPSVSLTEAKQQWAGKRKQLQQLAK